MKDTAVSILAQSQIALHRLWNGVIRTDEVEANTCISDVCASEKKKESYTSSFVQCYLISVFALAENEQFRQKLYYVSCTRQTCENFTWS